MRANNNGDFLSGMHLAVAYLQFNKEHICYVFHLENHEEKYLELSAGQNDLIQANFNPISVVGFL